MKSDLMTISPAQKIKNEDTGVASIDQFNQIKSIDRIDQNQHINKGKKSCMLSKNTQENNNKRVNFENNNYRTKSYSNLPREKMNNITFDQLPDNVRTQSLGHISNCTTITNADPTIDLVASALNKSNSHSVLPANNIIFDESIEKNIKIL